MTTIFNMIRDVNGYNGFGLPFSDTGQRVTLTGSVATEMVVPSNGNATYPNWIAVFSFSSGDDVHVGCNETATLPNGSVAASAIQMNPSARKVKSGDTLSFITASSSATVQVSYYAVY